MEAGVILNARIGSYLVKRSPFLSVYKERRAISTVEMHVHDTGFDFLRDIKTGNRAAITFGYRNGTKAEFSGEVTALETLDQHTLKLIVSGEDYKFIKTRITESYNDETPTFIIGQLCAQAGVPVGRIEVPDDPIPHINFEDVTVWRAFSKLRQMLIRNGCTDELDYWYYGGKLYYGAMGHSPVTGAGVDNILGHNFSTDCYSYLELPLTPDTDVSERVKIEDHRRGITGSYKIYSIRHLYDGQRMRTYIGYA